VAVLAILLPTLAIATTQTFEDRAADTGLTFEYFNGMFGEFYFVENIGGGVALLDFDNDGDLDVYLTQGHMLGKGKTFADASYPPPDGLELNDRLFRNDLVVGMDGKPQLHFIDVTREAGLDVRDYGMGVSAADYDNDGNTDLFITNWGQNRLLRNLGNGKFADVTVKAGLGAEGWGVSAAFLDYDRDGNLDLYVGNYVVFDPEKNKACFALNGAQDYCAPQFYEAIDDRLYRNRGDGTFEDATAAAGIDKATAPGLGVIAADFNGDGWTDIYVANDGRPNQLWINQKNGSFKDDAFLAGVAVNMEGAPEASMGVDAADFDADGDEDLFMTHLLGETNTIYVNDGQGWFEDRTPATGLGAPSKGFTSFGTIWFDYDNDGWLDLFIANGEVRVMPILARSGDKYPLHQPNQLFRSLGNGKFEESTGDAGDVFRLSEVSRGAAVGDIDNDGDLDIVVANSNGPTRLLINNIGNENPWIGFRLLDSRGRDAIGANIEITRKRAGPLHRRVRTDGSYASANSPRVLVGLGKDPEIERVTVHWPSGRTESWRSLSTGRFHTLVEGKGLAADKKDDPARSG